MLPRTDELQPRVGDAHDLGQVQQSLQGGLSHFAVDLLTDQEPPVPVDQRDGDAAEQHALHGIRRPLLSRDGAW